MRRGSGGGVNKMWRLKRPVREGENGEKSAERPEKERGHRWRLGSHPEES